MFACERVAELGRPVSDRLPGRVLELSSGDECQDERRIVRVLRKPGKDILALQTATSMRSVERGGGDQDIKEAVRRER